jgi:hypothetical protein
MLTRFRISQGEETANCCPDGEVLINNTHPLPRRSQAARRQVRTPDPRWRGLFLKQTLPGESPGYPVHLLTSSL